MFVCIHMYDVMIWLQKMSNAKPHFLKKSKPGTAGKHNERVTPRTFDRLFKEIMNEIMLETVMVKMSDEQRADLFLEVVRDKDYRGAESIMPMIYCFHQKSDFQANILRSQANEKLRSNGNFQEILMLLSESIAYAPENSKSLALAYANRSLVLSKNQQCREAIADNQRALKAGYPENLRYKLYTRQGKNYKAIKQLGRAVKCFKLATEFIQKANLEPIDKVKLQKGEIDPFLSELLNVAEEECEDVTQDSTIGVLPMIVPSLGKKVNPEIPTAADCISLQYNTTYGRNFVANRDIAMGKKLSYMYGKGATRQPGATRVVKLETSGEVSL
jgi:tetratricopeptide (TPR) repeat protein